uniref:RanBP-type and C3HC4-type zinc finger-containing protein 1 n=1 Tax=Spongospora subterranea TaxID=70186 RepID=A0A0H5R9R0_9EUKA|eukprot:CRZ10531.1 hypothetical protein [Spongospora subterranea]
MPNEQWTCLCSCENDADATVCEICEEPRPSQVLPDQPASVGWNCMLCNKLNSFHLRYCSCTISGYDNGSVIDFRLHAAKKMKTSSQDDSHSSEEYDSDVIICDESIEHAFTSYENAMDLVPIPAPRLLHVDLYEHQSTGLDFLIKSEINPKYRGSILADDMGLGKTVQSIALICARPASHDDLQHCVKTTLIICPVALADQWKEELDNFCPRLRSKIFHGPNRNEDLKLTVDRFDCVITTYPVIQSESRYAKKSLLLNTFWFRVILDEAHVIKNHLTICAKSIYELKAMYRLCLTGTPVQNSMKDLGSLFRFLNIKPWCLPKYFNKIEREIKNFQRNNNEKGAARKWAPVAFLLRSLLLRRKKTNILKNLPEKTVSTLIEEFSPEELEIYAAVEAQSIVKFNKMLKENTIIQNQCTLLVMLLRLRQCCCHPHLLPASETSALKLTTSSQESPKLSQVALKRVSLIEDGQLASQECGICLDAALPSPVVASCCGQVSCDDCFKHAIETSHSCPFCRAEQEEVLLVPLLVVANLLNRSSEMNDVLELHELTTKASNIVCSTKMNKLIKLLSETRDEDPSDKTIVFSQFTSFLDLITPHLLEHKFKILRYDGTLNRAQKTIVLKKFREDTSCTVLLASLKCASLGLNLVCARRVILLDVWWNPAVEDQAFDRVHRLGQKRHVYITRITIANSIEQRIIELQESKRKLAQAVLGEGEFKVPAQVRLTIADFKKLFTSSLQSMPH